MTIDWQVIEPAQAGGGMTDAEVAERIAVDASLRAFVTAAMADAEGLLVVVNDPMRSTRSNPVLQALSGMRREHATVNYSVLIATGTHRFDAAQREAFERSLVEGLATRPQRIVWHDSNDPHLVPIGIARYAPALAKARHILVVGSGEPHYFAGMTGPHKTITIGCQSHSDIERNHSLAMDMAAQPMRLAGNPVYDDIMSRLGELLCAGKQVFAVGEVVAGDHVVDLAIGRIDEVRQKLPAIVARTFVRTIAAQADVLHLRVTGPLGRTLYQADKAIKNNASLVRDGGTIILEATCEDGVGPDAFLSLLRDAATYADAMTAVKRNGYRLGDHKAARLLALMDPAVRNVGVALVARSLPPGALNGTQIDGFADFDTALNRTLSIGPCPKAAGIRIEDAGNVAAAMEAAS